MCAAVVRCAVHSGGQNGGKLSAPVAGRSPVEEPGRGNAGGPAGAEPFRAEKGCAGPAAQTPPLYEPGEHCAYSLALDVPAAVVEALERHDKLLICADAAAGALLEARLENLPGAEKVFDFGAVSYANPKTGPLIEKRARARLPKDCTDPLRQALARAQAARRVVGADLSAACAERESDCVLVLSCRKGCFLRTVPAGENPALWLLDIIRRTAANKPQAEGTGFLPARRAAKKDVLPGPQPRRHPLRRVCMTLLVLALLAALAAVGAWEYTNGNFYALPEQLHTLLTEHIPRPGATLV